MRARDFVCADQGNMLNDERFKFSYVFIEFFDAGTDVDIFSTAQVFWQQQCQDTYDFGTQAE